MPNERIDKLIASTGKFSRSEVKSLIRSGRVFVDHVPVKRAEEKYDPACVTIRVDGEEIVYARFTHIMLHKPAGILSATEDGHGQTVLDLLSPELRRIGLFPVGRLDKDTEGLLLLTNDGALAHRLLAPRSHVDKEYFVRCDGALCEEDCAAFAEGMQLGDGLHCLPAKLTILQSDTVSEAHIVLHEGKFHQIKRMLAARGKPVLYLKRLRMGTLMLDPTLPSGAYRPLTEEETQALYAVI